jgi:formate dehydrogenase subunit gamma
MHRMSSQLGATAGPKIRTAAGLIAAILLLAAVGPVIAQEPAVNPRADFWREVRRGQAGTTTSHADGHAVLIQNGGQNWRNVRNGLLAGISPWLLAGVLAAIGVFFAVVGKDRLEAEPAERIQRFSLGERALHWFTAAAFIVLALTGLSLLFGRAVLIPVFGYASFGGWAQAAKVLHNYSGPLFLAGALVEIAVWFKDNIPKSYDLKWFRTMGGMVGKGPRPHAGKVNGGEKAWFWVMLFAVLGVGITGVVMDFPNLGYSRSTFQVLHVVHVAVAMLFLAASFGHIYIGTIGAEGTFEGMWRGTVSDAWAKQHADLWYAEKTGDTPREAKQPETAG